MTITEQRLEKAKSEAEITFNTIRESERLYHQVVNAIQLAYRYPNFSTSEIARAYSDEAVLNRFDPGPAQYQASLALDAKLSPFA